MYFTHQPSSRSSIRACFIGAAIALCSSLGTAGAATLSTAAYTGSTPTLTQGERYGFPIVSDTQTGPATLAITSTSAGTILAGINSTGGHTNTGFQTNVTLLLNPGESVVAQSLSFTTGQFDDGYRLDYNGQTILSFNFNHYGFNADVRSLTGGGWTPWTNEGSPTLELDGNGLRLMMTAVSNGTGGAAGVLAGQRINILNYFGSDAYVPNPVAPDFVSGVQIALYNRNATSGWAISNASLTATAMVVPEPSSSLLALGGVVALGFRRSRRNEERRG